ncbi:hypothetical protein AAMO2058_000863700 [Amorphochlora amoebiformis]
MSATAPVVNDITDLNAKMKGMNMKKTKKERPRVGDYFLGRKLGGGATAIALIGKHVESGDKVALKVLFKLKQNRNRVRQVENELKALGAVKHKNVVQLLSVDYEGQYPHKDGSKTDAAIIALELCENGELFDYLMHTGSFSDDVARAYFHQLIEGLLACHSVGVVHRDLKPDNLLLDKKFLLKIADFGFASMPEAGEMHTCVGTEKYMAPEVVKGLSYKKGCDVWSCGVILFVMYAGYPPYVAPNRNDWWFDKLLKGNFKYFWMAHEQQRKFDAEFKDLINKMLTADEEKRVTLEGIQKHPWYIKKKPLEQEDLVKELQRRKPQVDNAKLEEGLERKNNSVEFAAGMRAFGGGRSIGVVPTTPKLVELDFKSLPEAQDYEPEMKSYTTVRSVKAAPNTLQYVLTILQSFGVKYSRDGYNVEGTLQQADGKLEFACDTFAEGKEKSIVEFRRLNGSFHSYRKFFQAVHDKLGRLEPKQKAESKS